MILGLIGLIIIVGPIIFFVGKIMNDPASYKRWNSQTYDPRYHNRPYNDT